MGEPVAQRRVGSSKSSHGFRAESLRPAEYGRAGAYYEQWLTDGFAQTAYYARDLAAHGIIRPETHQRVENELTGLPLDKLGKPYVSTFNYHRSPKGLTAEDGEALVSIFDRGYQTAHSDAVSDPRLDFRARRGEADVHHISYLEKLVLNPNAPAGTTVVIGSPCPAAAELGIPEPLLEEYHYQPELDMAMVWIATKTETGLQLQTVNFFHADSTLLARTISRVTRRPIPVDSREEMPWRRTTFLPDQSQDIAEELRTVFDELASAEAGQQTFHGLTPQERVAEISGETLVTHPDFMQARAATRIILEATAQSLVSGELQVDPAYLQKMLTLKKQDGTYELEGEERHAVQALLNGRADVEQFTAALQSVHVAACASLWAALRTIYDGGSLKSSADTKQASLDGLGNLEQQRQSGAVEYGCPGEGGISKEKSIFTMSSDALISMFLRKVFVTNCPLCNEKNVTATKENGTITCGSCQGCVEICTGNVIHKAKLKKRLKKVGKQAVRATRDIWSWLLPQKKKREQLKKLDVKSAKNIPRYEKIAA